MLPGRPTSVARLGYSGTSFELYYNAPAWDGGSDITKYSVELDTSASFNSANYRSTEVAIVNEVQSVKTVFSREAGRGGTFELLWGRKRTTPLAWNALADDVSEAIRIVTGAYNEATNPVENQIFDGALFRLWTGTIEQGSETSWARLNRPVRDVLDCGDTGHGKVVNGARELTEVTRVVTATI